MTENKARKSAIRALMAKTGERYSEAADRLDEKAAPPGGRAFFDAVMQEFGIPEDALSLALRYSDKTNEYPVLGAAAANCLSVYLDLKDWVALAKARHRISSLRQRTDLADVIAEISGFVTITGRSIAVEHQMRVALAARFGGQDAAPIRPFGLGIAFAVGDHRRLVLRGRDGAVPDMPDAQVRGIEIGSRAMGEYVMLRGPAPEDIPHLRAFGYRPEAVAEIEEDRLKREKELAAMLQAGTANRDRLGDIVRARYLYWELRDYLPSCLAQYGIDITDFFAKGKEWLTAFLDDIPSAAITITLAERGFRNSYKAWTGNDLRDADAMSAAIPYCDIVLADKYVAAQLAKSPAVAKLGTLVLARLRDLSNKLPGLIAARKTETP